MTRQGTQRQCSDIDECKEFRGFCEGDLHCTNTVGSYFCGCWHGYKQVVTSNWELMKLIPGCEDIDECTDRKTCPENSICENTAGSYTCKCHAGFQGNLCLDIDECTLTNTCHASATCSNSEGSYKCECKSGYHGNGQTCLSGYCDDRSCPSNAKCISPTTEQCECKKGFKSAGRDKKFCIDIDECGLCNENAICENQMGSFNCTCKLGYLGNGLSCKDVNECETGDHKCHEKAKCSNTKGSFNCSCETGYYGDGITCSENLCATGFYDADFEKCDSTYQKIYSEGMHFLS